MKTDKDIWIDEVMQSFEGKEDLMPSDGLFEKILQKTTIDNNIGWSQISLTIAAAMILLFVNVFAMRSYAQSNDTEAQYSLGSADQIISDYNIYDYE